VVEDSAKALGTCFGYAVRSHLPFDLLRRDNGDGIPLELTEAEVGLEEPPGTPLFNWFDQGRSFSRLHALDNRYLVWTESAGLFSVDPATPAIAMPPSSSGPRREARLWGVPIALCLMARGELILHAAAVDIDRTAVLLAAPGRYGKTTLAGAFLRAGHRLLSEDTTCVRLSSSPSVLPGPALLRVRPDAYRRLEFPGTHVVARDPDRVYLALNEVVRGDGRPVPIGGVVLLRRADGQARMERVPAQLALPDLWSLGFKFPSDMDRTRCWEGIAKLAAAVPIWNLHRRLSFDELPAVVDRIASTCLAR
jgi:hypothetical protein